MAFMTPDQRREARKYWRRIRRAEDLRAATDPVDDEGLTQEQREDRIICRRRADYADWD